MRSDNPETAKAVTLLDFVFSDAAPGGSRKRKICGNDAKMFFQDLVILLQLLPDKGPRGILTAQVREIRMRGVLE